MFLDAVRGLFSKKKSIDQIDSDELNRERIKLEQSETKMMKEIEQIEQQKVAFFRKGVDGGSQRQKLQIARKIKELDSLIKAKDKQLSLISKNLRVLSGLVQIKENQKLLADLGVSSLLSNMDIEEVQAYVEKATVEGQFQMERFTGLLNTMDESSDLEAMQAEDADTQAILAAMEMASGANSESAIDENFKKLNETLSPKTDEELL